MTELVHIMIDGESLAVPAFTTITAALAMRRSGATHRSVTGQPRACARLPDAMPRGPDH